MEKRKTLKRPVTLNLFVGKHEMGKVTLSPEYITVYSPAPINIYSCENADLLASNLLLVNYSRSYQRKCVSMADDLEKYIDLHWQPRQRDNRNDKFLRAITGNKYKRGIESPFPPGWYVEFDLYRLDEEPNVADVTEFIDSGYDLYANLSTTTVSIHSHEKLTNDTYPHVKRFLDLLLEKNYGGDPVPSLKYVGSNKKEPEARTLIDCSDITESYDYSQGNMRGYYMQFKLTPGDA